MSLWRKAVPVEARTRCPHCAAEVLRGVDADVAGIPVVVDVDPVDQLGEFLALMSGRRTFVYAQRGGKMVVRDRSAGSIGLNPSTEVMVLAAHACWKPLGTPLPPPAPDVPEFLAVPMLPCEACGLPAVTNPCSSCRRAGVDQASAPMLPSDDTHTEGEEWTLGLRP